jgi:hypothetical protein
MNSFDPGALSASDWYIDQIVNSLATAIADAAVAGSGAPSDQLLSCYHDACQLRASLTALKVSINDAAMREVMA